MIQKIPIIISMDVPGKLGSVGNAVGGFVIYQPSADRLIENGIFLFTPEQTEQSCFRAIWDSLEEWRKEYQVIGFVFEHPFIHAIAPWVGALKMWASVRSVPWYMITSSSARKTVLGSGKTGRGLAKANKLLVLDAMRIRFQNSTLTQHEADAALYAIAYSLKLQVR